MPQSKILIADTNFLIRKGLQSLIEETGTYQCVGGVADMGALHTALSKQKIEVLIVDHCCDDCFSLQNISQIRMQYAELKILIISHINTVHEIRSVIEMGINTILYKDCSEDDILNALKCATEGKKYLSKDLVEILISSEFDHSNIKLIEDITQREKEIIQLLISGNRPKEIAAQLCISENTVNTHKRNIYRKLNLNHVLELNNYAVQHGLLNT
jgi:DNA-binding NarL/FixJ family response regulator